MFLEENLNKTSKNPNKDMNSIGFPLMICIMLNINMFKMID